MIIEKLSTGKVRLYGSGVKQRNLSPAYDVIEDLENDFVIIREDTNTTIERFKYTDVDQLIRDNGGTVINNPDLPTLLEELSTNFFFDNVGSGGGFNFTYLANNFTDLNTVATQPIDSGTIAYVFNSEGTQWLPSTIGGSYYPAGIYVSDGSDWVSDRNSIAGQLQINVDDIDQLQADLLQEVIDRTNADAGLQLQISNMDAISLNPTGGSGQSYDWNTVITAGVYRGNGTTTNGPSGFNGFESVLVYTPVGSDYIVHQALDGTGTVFAFRRSNNVGVTWSVWTSVPSSSGTKEHRHIYFGARNTTDTVISFANVPVKVNGTTTQGFGTTGLVMSGLNRIVNNSGGTLRVEVKAEVSIDKEQGGGKDNFVFYINQTGANLIGSKSTTESSNNDDNTASPSWIGDMANGQWFEVWVQNIDSANDLKVSDFSLIVKEL